MGNILKVNLNNGTTKVVDDTDLVKKFIGGKGLNHKLAWEEIPKNASAFDPENRLLVSVGPLTGTAAPTSGRATVGGIAAQCHPEMYTHSGVGGWFPPELKYAGFDSVIIKGKASSPVYLYINDGKAEVRDASDLWGLGTYSTQKKLKEKHGEGVRTLSIGPAGENESRIAILLTDTENAAGQGGFGGVAGSKNLKAICAKGSQNIKIAKPERLLEIRKDLSRKLSGEPVHSGGNYGYDGHTIKDVSYERSPKSCSHACDVHCWIEHYDWPKETRPGTHSGQLRCVGPYVFGWQTPFGVKWPLWKVGESDERARSGYEMTELINKLGIDEWELLAGMVPWLVMGWRTDVINEDLLGMPVKADDPDWWKDLLDMIAYRKGFGDTLAKGMDRTLKKLPPEYSETKYSQDKEIPTKIHLQEAWGYAGHWSGRGIHLSLPFPQWLLRALCWMTATRDLCDDTHIASKSEWNQEFKENPYTGKRGPKISIWNEHRSELKSSLTLCDWAFPRPGEQSDAEAKLFSAVTGINVTESKLDKIGERLKNMQRALLIRNHERDREMEFNEILPYLKRPDGTEGITVDVDKFNTMVDTYYEERGWDKETGRPTRSKLEELDLGNVAETLENEGTLPS